MSGSGIGFGGVVLWIASSVFAPTCPSMTRPLRRWKSRTALSRAGPNAGPAVQANESQNPGAALSYQRLRSRFSCVTAGPFEPCSRIAPFGGLGFGPGGGFGTGAEPRASAVRVASPTCPSGSRAFRTWKSLTAVSSAAPKPGPGAILNASQAPGAFSSYQRLRSRFSFVTAGPREPRSRMAPPPPVGSPPFLPWIAARRSRTSEP